MKSSIGMVLLLIVVVALMFAGPWFTILALNALFGLSIPVNLTTWVSAFWLGMLVYGKTK